MDFITNLWSQIQASLGLVVVGLGVLVALFLLVFIFRSIQKRSGGGRGERLAITEFCEVDENRRLVLIRRDNVEHLLLIGGPQDVVVESGISLMAAELGGQEAAAAMPEDPLPFRSPREPVFGARRPALRPVEFAPAEGEDQQL